MFVINEDNSIYATRGDIVFFGVSADDEGVPYHFQPGDIVRIKIYGKKDAETVVLQKDFPVLQNCEEVDVFLNKEDTKIGEVISKPSDYWYDVELNPDTNPQTIVGYSEDGPALFKLFPEGADIDEDYDPSVEDFPVVDEELDLSSPRPIANKVVAYEIERLKRDFKKDYVTPQNYGAVGDGVADDTHALQTMLDTGARAFIPCGNYKVTAPLTATNSIHGETGATIHYYPNETGHKGCINISGERTLVCEDAACVIEGKTMTLEGNDLSSLLKSGDYVYVHTNVLASAYCREYDTKQDMLEVESVDGAVLTFTTAPEWTDIDTVSLYRMDFVKDIEVCGVNIVCENYSSSCSGILISNAMNATVHNCHVSNFDYAQIDIEYAVNAHAHDNHCAVNYEDGLQYGILYSYTYNGTIYGNTVNSERTAIDISYGSQYVTVTGNTTRGNINTHWAMKCLINGNTINDGVILLRGKNLTVSNNYINQMSGEVSCIDIMEGGSEGGHVIQGNTCHGVICVKAVMSGTRILNNTFKASVCPVYNSTEQSIIRIANAAESATPDVGVEISGNLIEYSGADEIKYGIDMYYNTDTTTVNVRIANNVIRNAVNGIYALNRSNETETECHNLSILRNDLHNVRNGIRFRGMNNTVIANNNIEGSKYENDYGIIRGNSATCTSGLIIIGNLVDGFTEGLRVYDGTGTITDGVITSNCITNCTTAEKVSDSILL